MSQYDIGPNFECQNSILNVKIRYLARFRMSKNEKRKTKSEKRIVNNENRKTNNDNEKIKTNQLHLAQDY